MYRRVLREDIRSLASPKTLNDDELDLLLVNAVSSEGKFCKLREEIFSNEEDKENFIPSNIAEETQNYIEEKVQLPSKGETIEKFKEIIQNYQDKNRLSQVFYNCGLSPNDDGLFTSFEDRFCGNSRGSSKPEIY